MNNYDYLNIALPLKKRIKSLISMLTLEEKIGFIPTRQAAVPRLGIKEYSVGTEIARGYVSHEDDEPATVFPQPTGMASITTLYCSALPLTWPATPAGEEMRSATERIRFWPENALKHTQRA